MLIQKQCQKRTINIKSIFFAFSQRTCYAMHAPWVRIYFITTRLADIGWFCFCMESCLVFCRCATFLCAFSLRCIFRSSYEHKVTRGWKPFTDLLFFCPKCELVLKVIQFYSQCTLYFCRCAAFCVFLVCILFSIARANTRWQDSESHLLPALVFAQMWTCAHVIQFNSQLFLTHFYNLMNDRTFALR